jgi:hypothetical protein
MPLSTKLDTEIENSETYGITFPDRYGSIKKTCN